MRELDPIVWIFVGIFVASIVILMWLMTAPEHMPNSADRPPAVCLIAVSPLPGCGEHEIVQHVAILSDWGQP